MIDINDHREADATPISGDECAGAPGFNEALAERYQRLSLLTLDLAEEAGKAALDPEAYSFDRPMAAMTRAIWAHQIIERLRLSCPESKKPVFCLDQQAPRTAPPPAGDKLLIPMPRLGLNLGGVSDPFLDERSPQEDNSADFDIYGSSPRQETSGKPNRQLSGTAISRDNKKTCDARGEIIFDTLQGPKPVVTTSAAHVFSASPKKSAASANGITILAPP